MSDGTKYCTKCLHSLPPGRRTWKPRWQQRQGADPTALHYAGEGPALGKIYRIGDRWIAAVWDGEAVYREVDRLESAQAACVRVEHEVRARKMWAPWG